MALELLIAAGVGAALATALQAWKGRPRPEPDKLSRLRARYAVMDDPNWTQFEKEVDQILRSRRSNERLLAERRALEGVAIRMRREGASRRQVRRYLESLRLDREQRWSFPDL